MVYTKPCPPPEGKEEIGMGWGGREHLLQLGCLDSVDTE